MKYCVYAILSKVQKRIYVGMSSNVDQRLSEHNKGGVKSTRAYRPWILIFTEECEERNNARGREKYWKSGYGKERLKQIIPR